MNPFIQITNSPYCFIWIEKDDLLINANSLQKFWRGVLLNKTYQLPLIVPESRSKVRVSFNSASSFPTSCKHKQHCF